MNAGVPVIETMRLILREWRDGDIEPLGRILADPAVTRYLFDGKPLNADETLAAYRRRQTSWRERGLGLWAVELKETGELIGWAGLQHVDFEEGFVGEVEVAWTLGERWWRHGYATEAAEASLRHAFSELSLERVYGFHAPANVRSERVMARLGMEPAGVTVDVRDAAESKVRVLTKAAWTGRIDREARSHPHSDPAKVVAVVGYDAPPGGAFLTCATAEWLHEALLAALVRTWPGPRVPGAPRVFKVAGDPAETGVRVSAERSRGHLPLLVVADLAEPEDAGEPLRALQDQTLREGVWLHVDLAMRHGAEFDGVGLADSLAFDLPTPYGRRRLFATRHTRILDEEFMAAMGLRESGNDGPLG